MRPLPGLLTTLAISGTCCLGAVRLPSDATYKHLWEVYGSAEEAKKSVGVRSSRKTRCHSETPEDDCAQLPLQLVLVQDQTFSFNDDIDNMYEHQLNELYEGVMERHKGSRIGLATFGDIPIPSLGWESDFCYFHQAPLGSDLETLREVYRSLQNKCEGGADLPEWQFGAILYALNQAAMDWHWDDIKFIPIIVLITDAQPHFSDDGSNRPQMNLTDWKGYDEKRWKELCTEQYAPSPETVRNELYKKGVHLVQMIYNSDGAAAAWEWFNEFIEQPKGFVGDLNADSSNFYSQLEKVLENVLQEECKTARSIPRGQKLYEVDLPRAKSAGIAPQAVEHSEVIPTKNDLPMNPTAKPMTSTMTKIAYQLHKHPQAKSDS